MSESTSQGKRQSNTYLIANKFSSVPYDIKIIRDSLKTNLYRAANFLNMTHTQAKAFLERIERELELEKQGVETNSEITVFQSMIASAVIEKKWNIIEMLLDRIMGKPAMQIHQVTEHRTMLDDLTLEQKKNIAESVNIAIQQIEVK